MSLPLAFALANIKEHFSQLRATGSTEIDIVLVENATFCPYPNGDPLIPSFASLVLFHLPSRFDNAPCLFLSIIYADSCWPCSFSILP